MITYYHFSNWCGYFRTVSSTETSEVFEKHLKDNNLKREGNKILKIEDNTHCGVIEKDTTNNIN